MTARKTHVSFETLAEQVTRLLAAGGTLGSIYDYTEHDCEVMYTLGHGLYAQGRFADAVKVFGFLAMHNHLERRYMNAFAASLQMVGSHEEAIKFYTLASIMDATDPVPTFHTCECLIALGMKDNAIEGLQMVVAQCRSEAQRPLGERAAALIKLLESPETSATHKQGEPL